MSLLKTGEHAAAEREIKLLGDLQGQNWHYERYPAIANGRKGSMVPFGMLLLNALLPAFTDDFAAAQQRLYDLLTVVQQAGGWPGQAAGGSCKVGDGDDKQQEQTVLLALADTYCASQDYPLAVAHLEQVVASCAGAAKPLQRHLSLLGRVHIQTGNLEAAGDAFDRLECLLREPDACVDVHLNRGYLCVAQGDYPAALEAFGAVLAVDETHVLAASNRAVCLLYCCRLADAVAALEEFLKVDPVRNAEQTILSNLATLYRARRHSLLLSPRVAARLVLPTDSSRAGAQRWSTTARQRSGRSSGWQRPWQRTTSTRARSPRSPRDRRRRAATASPSQQAAPSAPLPPCPEFG